MQKTFRARESIGEIIGGVLLTALGAVWAATSIGYGLIGDGGRLAPGTVPFGAGLILALCGIAIAVKGVVVALKPAADATAENNGLAAADDPAAARPLAATTQSILARTVSAPRTNPVLVVFALVTAGVLAMPVIGFSVAFAVTIFFILLIVERQRAIRALLISVVTAGFGYVLFEVIFRLPLPAPFFL